MSDEWQRVEHVTPPSGEVPQNVGVPPLGPPGGWANVPPSTMSYSASAASTRNPYASPAGYAVAPPQTKSHTARNVVLIVLGVVFLLMAGCGAVVYKGLTVLRDSGPTQLAVHTAERSPLVQQRIGTPLKPSLWTSGNVNTSLSAGVKSGSANLKISVTGPRGQGTLLAIETLGNDGWKIGSLSYSDSAGTTPLVENGTPHGGPPQEETF